MRWSAQPQRSATELLPLRQPVSADEHWQSTGAAGGDGGEGHVPHVTGQAVACPYWELYVEQPGSLAAHHAHVYWLS